MPSFWCTSFLLFISLSLFTKNASGWHKEFNHPTYQLTEPVRLAVESDQGMITSYLNPGQRLRFDNPNNNFICAQMKRIDYTAFLVPPDQHQVFKKHMVSYIDSDSSYRNQLSRYLSNLGSDGKAWVIFLKSDNILIPSGAFRRVQLRSIGSSGNWEIDALMINSPDERDEQVDVDYPDDTLSAPPPSYQSLCVGPEFPKPYPVLYSFPPNIPLRPAISYFNIADVTPVAVN